jgi:hypothetical protein
VGKEEDGADGEKHGMPEEELVRSDDTRAGVDDDRHSADRLRNSCCPGSLQVELPVAQLPEELPANSSSGLVLLWGPLQYGLSHVGTTCWLNCFPLV